MKLRALPFILALITPLTLASPKLEDGYDAFDKGDVDSAVQIWRELAEHGNATAQLNLGQLYRLGKGVEQNDEEAVKWYTLAAQNGSEIAAYTLTLMQQEGRATREDLDKAMPEGFDMAAAIAPSSEPKPEPKPGNSTTPSWIETIPPESYLIQVIASSDPAALQSYSNDKLPGFTPRPTVVKTLREAKLWYLLVIGPFDTRELANAALKSLPGQVKKNKPWPRTAASIQDMT